METNGSILVAGETLVDFLPASSSPLSAVETFSRRPGGAPANVAVRLRQLGCDPLLWTRVGADPFGDFLVETLESHGVDQRFVERDPDAPTSLAFVSEHSDDPRFVFYRDGTADTRLQPGTIPDDVLETLSWIAVGGVTLASEPARGATVDLVDRATAAGCRVLFDPNARPELWDGSFEREVRRLLDRVDVVTATPGDLHRAGFEGGNQQTTDPESDGERLAADAESDGERLAAELLAAGPDTVVLTHGDRGATAYATADAPWDATAASHDGYDVPAVDDTGAGDAFTAGLLTALSRGERSLAGALEFANRVGAAATLTEGGIGELPLDRVGPDGPDGSQ